jgi:beta-phosphoglucomutase
MLRGVVFDMDGVIVDSHPAHLNAWKSFLASEGLKVRDEDLEFVLDGRKRAEILRHFFGELTPEQIVEYGNRKNEALRECGQPVQPILGVVDFLCQLSEAGIGIALATSGSQWRAHSTLEEHGLTGYFQAVITGDEITAGKPDPAIYRLAAERLQESPQHLLAVEDAVSGVKSARAAGMRCLGIANERRAALLRAAGAELVIPDFRALSVDQLEDRFC